MRRRSRSLIYALAAGYALCVAAPVLAQGMPGQGHGPPQADPQEEAKKKKRDQDFGAGPNLPKVRNAGPCPFVRVLYDAARYVEFKNGVVASSAVGYTGEIENIASTCAYKGAEPIHVQAQALFGLGKGPQAEGRSKTYRFWVAVTDRNRAIIDKQYYNLPITFPAGQDRMTVTEALGTITIPRATPTVSGANFEMLVGFEVTPEMAAFNRDGKRFRPNVGQTAQASTSPSAPPP
jgi:hypothetical protein